MDGKCRNKWKKVVFFSLKYFLLFNLEKCMDEWCVWGGIEIWIYASGTRRKKIPIPERNEARKTKGLQ